MIQGHSNFSFFIKEMFFIQSVRKCKSYIRKCIVGLFVNFFVVHNPNLSLIKTRVFLLIVIILSTM